MTIPNDAVTEFTVLQNPFSPEFGPLSIWDCATSTEPSISEQPQNADAIS